MAKVVCKNCGTKNPSSAASCSNCGQFLGDSTPSRQSTNPSFNPATVNVAPGVDGSTEDETEDTVTQTYDKPYEGPVETVKVPGGNASQTLGMLSGFVILGIFMVLEYTGISFPTYALYAFIALIFVIPTLLRKVTTTVKFTPSSFFIPASPEVAPVEYENIMNAKLGAYNRYEQSVTLYFKSNQPALKLDFNSMTNFRTLVMTLNRRRIPILREKPPENGNQEASQ